MENINYESCQMCNFEVHKSILIVVSSNDKLSDCSDTGIWFEEFAIPYSALIDNGYEVTVVSPKGGEAPIDRKSLNNKWETAQKSLQNTRQLASVDYERYDALILPGGHGPMFDLCQNETLGKIINHFSKKNKLIGAICHGPAGLLSVPDFVKGRRLTCITNEEEHYHKSENKIPFYLEDALKNLGADFVKSGIGEVNVVKDDNLITAQNYQSTELFTKMIIDWLKS
ncbi:type 1 glutamine amidotransferase domain-containing protein [bacterium]|nr:type 1 glutamine amidotransferase domain-containing protein [bacterium]